MWRIGSPTHSGPCSRYLTNYPNLEAPRLISRAHATSADAKASEVSEPLSEKSLLMIAAQTQTGSPSGPLVSAQQARDAFTTAGYAADPIIDWAWRTSLQRTRAELPDPED
jgi:hypothetical protein